MSLATRIGPSPAAPSPWERGLWAAFVYALFFLGYGLINRAIPLHACWDLTTAWDRATPFVPAFVWPFYLAYPLIGLPALALPSRESLRRAALAFAVLFGASFLLFVLFPVTVPRPTVVSQDLASRLVARLYAADRPVCGFPSLHVSAAVLANAALFRTRRVAGWLFLPVTVATSAATLFVKQHVWLDVAGGLGLALAVDRLVLGDAGRRAIRILRAGWALRRLGSAPAPTEHGEPSGDTARIAGAVRCLTATGTAYDHYPAARDAGHGPAVLVSGLTLRGERDERLVRFAQTLAAAGIEVAAPSLPGLYGGQEDVSDLEHIVAVVQAMGASGGRRVTLVGFSVGGALALVAASQAPLRDLVAQVIVSGAPYDLGAVWEDLTSRTPSPADSPDRYRDDLYAHLLMAHRSAEALGLAPGLRATLQRVLEGFCAEEHPGTAQALFETELRDLPIAERARAGLSREALSRLSPRGQLGGVEAEVFVLADPEDRLVPLEHARRIRDELSARGPNARQRLVITRALSHVGVGRLSDLYGVLRLLDVYGHLFCPRNRP